MHNISNPRFPALTRRKFLAFVIAPVILIALILLGAIVWTI